MRIRLDEGQYRLAGWVAGFLLTLLLSSCGFQLRGQSNLPFDTLHIAGATPMLVDLKRNVVAGSKTRLVDTPNGAEAILEIVQEAREKVILSLDTSGRVEMLRDRVGFRVHDGKGQNWIPTGEIALTRDISFNDAQIIAKENEEALLYRDMQSDMVQQIMRRLTRAQRSGG